MNDVQRLPETEPVFAEAVSVDIYDQTYLLRGSDSAYIERLADLVDGKMRAVAAQGGTVDSLRVAVLAALNLADELAMLRERYSELSGSMSQAQRAVRSRAGSLSHLLDEAMDNPTSVGSLEERRVG